MAKPTIGKSLSSGVKSLSLDFEIPEGIIYEGEQDRSTVDAAF